MFFGFFCGVEKCSLFLSCFGSPPRRPKRVQEAPKRPQEALRSAPRGPKRLPRAPQEASRGPQETLRAVQKPQNPPKSSQEPPKTPTKLFRSTWSGSRFRKNEKIEITRFFRSTKPCSRFRKNIFPRSPVSMNPKGLASKPQNEKKAGGRRWSPLGKSII